MTAADNPRSVAGDNSEGFTQPTTKFAKDQLKSFIERVERLEENKKEVSEEIRDVYAEAKGNGFDAKAMRHIVKLRKMDADERREQGEIIELYAHALGMLDVFA